MAGYIGSGASVVSSGVENKKVFDITTNTTSLTGLNYTVGKVHVYHNGVRLVDGTDFTATNSTSIALTVAAVSGDQVVVVSFASFQVAGSYTEAEADARFVTKTGDTMSGNLGVTGTVTSDGLVVSAASANIDVSDTGTGFASQDFLTNSGAARTTIGVERSAGGGLFVGSSPYAAVFGSAGANPTQIVSNNTVRMTVDTSGRVTKPNQPAFYVCKGTAQEPIGSTINTAYTITYTSEVYDEGNNFANSTFTAPVTGKYLLMAQVQMTFAETQGNAYILTLNTSNRAFGQNVSQKFSSTPTFSTLFAKNVVDMDAGDTATVKLRYFSVVGSNPDVPSGYDEVTWFSGYLLG